MVIQCITCKVIHPIEKLRLLVTLPDSTLLLISANLTSDACFVRNSCLFCLIILSATLTFLSLLLSFLACFFLFTPDAKEVISGNLDPSVFPLTKSCAKSSMHNGNLPLKMRRTNINLTFSYILTFIINFTKNDLMVGLVIIYC